MRYEVVEDTICSDHNHGMSTWDTMVAKLMVIAYSTSQPW
jgi:hypothetical protein